MQSDYRIPHIAWALLISALLHAALVLLAAPAPNQLAANGGKVFVFQARLSPNNAQPSTVDLTTPQPENTIANTPAQPPQDFPTLSTPAPLTTDHYYEVRELNTVPSPKQTIEPQYPPNALASKITGVVHLEMFVDEHGEIQSLHVTDSTSAELFDQAALDAFRNQQFVPGMKDGKPVKSHLKLTINFGDHPSTDSQ